MKMNSHQRAPWRRGRRGFAAIAVLGTLVGLVALTGPSTSGAAPAHRQPAKEKPTIVLVHGAFADASGWSDVTQRLQAKGYTVIAPANPLRSVEGDSAYLGSVIDDIKGPVVLVGHSYGGVLITNAATGRSNVKALVYLAAFAPQKDEAAGTLAAMNPGSMLTPENLVIRPYPGGNDGYIKPEVFREVFAGDLPKSQTAVMATAQRPGDFGTLTQPSGEPGWETIPSWYLVASKDNAIPAATQRFMAKRAKATTVEVKSSHVVMMSQPEASTKMIIEAANS